jgi:hypothetical protein
LQQITGFYVPVRNNCFLGQVQTIESQSKYSECTGAQGLADSSHIYKIAMPNARMIGVIYSNHLFGELMLQNFIGTGVRKICSNVSVAGENQRRGDLQ